MYHLAQINVRRMLAPLGNPLMAGFVERLGAINALADTSPGFVWRLQAADGDATAVRAYDDERIIVNMSVWESLFAFSFARPFSAPGEDVIRMAEGIEAVCGA